MFLISYSLQFRSTPCTLPRRGFVCGLQHCLARGVIWQHLLRAEWDAAELLCALLLPAGSETLQCGERSPQLSFPSCTSSTGSSCSQCRARTHTEEEVCVFVSPLCLLHASTCKFSSGLLGVHVRSTCPAGQRGACPSL